MGTILGNQPMRMRQFLSSSDGMIRPVVRLDSEPPPKVKEFIDRVMKWPLYDIATPLGCFTWEYNKGNFHHWRPLFLHFDDYFKTYISMRKDLTLSNEILSDVPFPKHEVLSILKVMRTILENCPNKSSFSGLEHFNLLLASTDTEVVLATLQTLSALLRINPSKLHVSGKMLGCGSLNGILLSLAQGWGSKEEGLGLFSCLVANEQQVNNSSLHPEIEAQQRLASTLHFEFRAVSNDSVSSSLSVIHIPDLHMWQEDDLVILKQCVEKYNVPVEHRFALLTRIKFARAVRSGSICRDYSRMCLLAFIALVQSSDAQDELIAFFANEPEFTVELLKLVRSENAVPEDIRTLAMVALGAHLTAYSSNHDRARILSGSSVVAAGGSRAVLLGVLQKAIASLNNCADSSSTAFISALLNVFLLHVISSSTSGSSMRGSGLVPALLPLLQDVNMAHINLVCTAVKILQKLMDYTNAAVTSFRDLGGVDGLISRLQVEINRVLDESNEKKLRTNTNDPSSSVDDFLYSQKRLIKALLKGLGSATYAPTNTGRAPNPQENSLPASLSMIFCNARKFGGDIYFSAVTVMSEMIHKDPTCFPLLYEAGLPEAFLSSVVNGVLPSSKALSCIPSGLGAICLNPRGLEAVREQNALRFLIEACTTRKYLVAINEGIVSLANSLEELLRHVSSLRSTGVDIIIEIIEKLALLGEPSSSTMDNESAMETDLDEKEGQSRIVSVDATESMQEAITADRFFELCIFHVMLLVHRTMENAETCRLFVEKKGLEAMMKLLLHPNIVQSSEGFSSSFCSASVFRGFMQQHSVPLAKVFCSSLRVHLKKALSAFDSVSGSFMLDPKVVSNKEIFSSLFVVEYLMFLMDASKESRWLTALLNEFGDGAKDVLEDVGRVHREAIWQLALLEDSKLEKKDVNDSSSAQTDRASTTSVALDQRLSTFRQFIDPLLRRRAPGFGIESQLLDFVNLYSDVSRGSSMRRLGIDVLSNMRVGSTHQPQPSSSSDGASASKSESEKQKSFHTSCCDMMRSLFFHVNHLFLELGKVMVLPSRRRDDVPNVTPAAKSVLSTFASIVLDDLNFSGHVDSSKSEPSVSAKCRYMGKIVDFIDVILLDRSDSCNPLLVNCFYSQGVIQSILTTFEATSQLLFTVIRPPASPMELEEGDSKPDEQVEAESSWIYGALASCGLLMDHLVTSSFILAPFTKHLLVQPLSSGTTVPARDAETFVKLLQSKVLKSVLPIWNHPQFPDCSYELVSSIISIVRHIYSGVEVKISNSGVGSRTAGPPPDESTVSTIVEMGFSRSRAEEALRQVGINSVEMAMEWLLSHPEEIQEDDELARALAMSLGNAGSSGPEEIAANNVSVDQEVENVHLPPIDELLSSCLRLLQTRENLAYPVRELLLMMCSQNDSQCRAKVIGFILEHLKAWPVIPDYGNDSLLSALFHVLALVLHEDSATREVAAKNGLVMVALDLLAQWEPQVSNRAKCDVPKWVTASLLAIDQMLQVETKWNAELFGSEFAKKDDSESHVSSAHKGEDESRISSSERRKLIEIVCRFIWKQLPSETMHVVLQLCATLTRDYAVAVNFLESGGLVSLISLPPSSLFAGFDGIASTIVRHILEDPHTLQQAMEFEIRHTLLASLNRHPSGRMTPRNFLSNMASVISRDPCVFMLAAQSVCQIEMVGERPYVVLAKDRDKERNKEKEKPSEKDNKLLNVDTKAAPGETNAAGIPCGNSHVKQLDANCKSFKSHKKAPQSFVTVIELLLDNVLAFNPPKDDTLTEDHHTSSSSQMDIDVATSKGKGKALASVSDENKPGTAEISATLAKMVFILKLLSEILLTYASSIHILLRKDLEAGNFRGQVLREAAANRCAGIFQHVLHKFLPYSLNPKKDKKEGDWKHKLGSKASQFLVASAVRSTEARRRIFSEINAVCGEFVEISSSNDSKKPNSVIQVFVDLLNEILVARSPNGSFISAEAASTFTDVGLVTSMTRILQVLDLDHGDSQRIVTMIVKALESVTKEHVHSSDSSSSKGDASNQASLQNRNPGTDSDNIMRLGDSNSRPVNGERLTVSVEPFIGGQTAGSLDSIADLMDHDRDLDGNIVPEADDDFMHENSDVAGGLDNGITSVGITFEIQQNPQDNMVDDEDDEEMSEDGGDDVDEDEDDEDDQDNEDLDEEVHHMSHQDADHDDHEIDEDEFDEDIMDEDDEDDEDDENGLILRLEDGINGINVLDHIEVFSRNNLSNEGLHVMPVEIFGSRRQGRTTSIYNLLGRTGDQGIPIQHPLLTEPSLSTHSAVHRQSGDNVNDLTSTEQITENSSSDLDAIFRSLRSGRQGSRLSMWTDDSQLRGGANAALITQSMEEAFVSHLSKPNPSQPSDKPDTVAQSEQKTDSVELRHEPPSDSMIDNSNQIVQPSASMTISANENVEAMPVSHEFLQEQHPIMEDHAVDMQYEHGDVVIRDVEAVSQESGGSGATIGESLRSLEVEIGSADGHEEGADRQSGTDRLQLGDSQLNRSRQAGLSLGNNLPVNESNVLHETVNETSNDPNLTSNDSDTAEMQEETRVDSSAIDPAFLEALPEDLRAEVLQAQRSQVVQPPNEQAHSTGDIDPEFLAALPPDIRAEVLAQQQAQRLQASQELEGQPVEMDTVSIIATFPSDLREEVLLTSDNSILANLTPALMAEANLLRERFAHRYHSRGIFGIRNRRGEPSGRVDSISDRVGGTTARQIGAKVPEAEGAPIVDTDALKALVRLLRIFQPLYKSHLQRLLLNLCAHRETRTALVQILMDMLMLDVRGPGKSVTSSGELTYRLYGCQNCLSYSRPQFLEGVPPLLSRRILETLTYLSRHHPQVAKLLLHHQLLQPSGDGLKEPDSGRGKAVLLYEDETAEKSYSKSEVAIVLLLSLLNQPLYLRSVAHLEQLLNLLEVVIDNAQSNSSGQPKSGVAQQPPSSSTAQIPPDIPQPAMDATDASGSSSNKLPSSEAGPSNSALDTKDDDSTILNHLPDMELRLLCSLLAQEGLSDSAYVVAAEVLKKIVAIAPMHCVLFVNELAGSVRNLIKSAMDELKSYGEAQETLVDMALAGSAILRVVQALTSLVSSLLEKEKDPQSVSGEQQSDAIMQVWEINTTLEPLWLELSNCISTIESNSDTLVGSSHSSHLTSMSSSALSPLPAGSQNILPYIESFFVACEKLHPGQTGGNSDIAVAVHSDAEEPSTSTSGQKSQPSIAKFDEKHAAFVKFAEKHRRLLNSFIRQNPVLLEKSFSLMLKVPRFVEFDNKRAHFRSKIKHQHDHHQSPLRISVRRAYILEDSYNQLRMRSAQELKGRLTVHFQGEEGIDAGGLTREWYQVLSRVVFDKGALLFTTVGNESTFQPNPNSVYQTEHLSYFKFVGRVVAKALFDGQLLDVHFTRSFYKHILGVKVTYHDIEAIDPDYFKNLKWVLENDISDMLDLTFSIDADEEKLILYERNEVTDHELVPGGRNIRVTEENKHEYVGHVAEHRLTTAIRPQINSFLEGFNELIPRDLISIFNDKELELLISGLPDIDLEDMRANTEYSGYTVGSPVIQWFWEVVQSFSKEDKARLLQFVTGTSKVPLEGFSALQGISGSQRFQIHKAYGSAGHLPSAHTCFNQLDLPEYPSKEQLQERLLLAIHEANEGFGFG